MAIPGLIVNDASKRVRFDLPLTGTTDFTVTVVSASDWMVSWNLTGSGFTLESVLIKDGVSSPHNLLYRFYPVIGGEGLIGSGTVQFNSPVKGISFVEFFGSPVPIRVPDDGTTAMLLVLLSPASVPCVVTSSVKYPPTPRKQLKVAVR